MDTWPVKTLVAGAVFALILTTVLVPQFKAANPQSKDILAQVMGGTADLAADQAYREADVYFHAGLRCVCPDREPHHAEGDADHCDQVEQPKETNLPLLNAIRHMQGEAAPRTHKHLTGAEEKEILPWFVVAVRLNPHHVEAWRTGAYWFFRTGDVKRAQQFIGDGIRNNPNDYRLYLDGGIIHHHMSNWTSAVKDLEAAERLWKNNSEDAPYDLRAIKTYLRDSRGRSEQ